MTTEEKLRIYADEYRKPPYGRAVDGTAELLEEAAEIIERLQGSENRDIIFRRCICEYGDQPQIDVAIEEMSELIKALLKWRRAKGKELTKTRDDIIDEIADVRIMCRQMEILFQAEQEVEHRINFKVDRQRKRLDARENSTVEQDLPLPPCKIGDTVWELCKCDDGVNRIFPMQIKTIVLWGSPRMKDGHPTTWNIYAESDYTKMYKSFYDIGRTVFLNRDEAEQKLRELEADYAKRNC